MFDNIYVPISDILWAIYLKSDWSIGKRFDLLSIFVKTLIASTARTLQMQISVALFLML